MPKIIVQKDTEIVSTFNLPGRREITVGCSTGCDVPIEDPSIAPKQAKIVLEDDGFHLRLLSHIPPVFVTGERVEGDVRLHDGDTVRIEGYDLILNVLPDEIKVKEEPPPEKPEPKKVEEKKPIPPEPAMKPEESVAVEPVPSKQEEVFKPEPEVEKPVQEVPIGEKSVPPIMRETGKFEAIKTEEIRAKPVRPASPQKPAEQKTEKEKLAREAEKIEPERQAQAPAEVKPEPVTPPEIEEKPVRSSTMSDRKTQLLKPVDAIPQSERGEKHIPAERNRYLLAISGPLKGESFKLKKGANSIGRDRKKNDIIIRLDSAGELDKSISRRHAGIDYSNGVYFLSDNASQMRTKLNGRILSKTEKPALEIGDIIEICSLKESTVFRFAEEGRFDFSSQGRQTVDVAGVSKSVLPYVVIIAAVLIIVLVLVLIFK